MRKAPEPGSVGERLRDIRETARLRLEDAVPKLNALSRQLFGPEGPLFTIGRVSKLELGVQRASLDDIALYAALDPKRRGKLWLAWDESEDSTMRETPAELAARLGVAPPRRGQPFPAPGAVKKATQAGGQKRNKP